MLLKRINSPGLGDPAGPYSHAVRHGNTLYTSGFTAYGTPAQSASAEDQADAIFDQLEIVAGEENISMEKLVKVSIFITDPGDIPALRNTLARRYGAHAPASSLLLVKGLFAPELAVEIEAIFALD
jgi:2-iminobutanoate/2-iminopropanoate deaminase